MFTRRGAEGVGDWGCTSQLGKTRGGRGKDGMGRKWLHDAERGESPMMPEECRITPVSKVGRGLRLFFTC